MADFTKDIKINIETASAVKSLNQLEKEIIDANKALQDLAKQSIDADEQTVKSLQKLADAQIKIVKDNQKALADIGKAKEANAKAIVKAEEDAVKASIDAEEKAVNSVKERKDAIVEAGVRTAQAFVTTTSAVLAYASSEEDATKVTAALGKAMAVADSIEQVYNATKAIGEVRTKLLAAAEVTKTTATVASTAATTTATAATNAQTTSIGFLRGAINLLLGPVGLLIAGLGIVVGYFLLLGKSNKELYDDLVKTNDEFRRTFETSEALKKAQQENTNSRINNDFQRESDANAKRIEQLKDFGKLKEKTLKALEAEATAAALIKDKKEREEAKANTEARINEAKILFENAEKELTDIKRTEYEARLDLDLLLFNKSKDLQLAELASLKGFSAQRSAIKIQEEKAIADIQARFKKGEIDEVAKQKEIAKVNQETLNSQISLLEQEKTVTAGLVLEAQKLGDELSNIKDFAITDDISGDAANQINAAEREFKRAEQNAKALTQTAIDELGVIDANADEAAKKRYNDRYEAIIQIEKNSIAVAKNTADEKTKIAKNTEAERLFAVEEANQRILESENNVLEQIKGNDKVVVESRIEASNKLTKIQLSRIEIERKEAIRQAIAAKKSIEQINQIQASYVQLADEVEKANEKFAADLKINRLLEGLDKVGKALTALSEINLFSGNNGIDNFIRGINGISKAIQISQSAFNNLKTAIKKPVEGESPEALKQRVRENAAAYTEIIGGAVIAITQVANEIAQAAFQANIDSFQKQVDVLEEKKAEIDEELQASADKITELQDNAAKAQIADRTRIIGLIEKERKREAELAKQKALAAKQQLELEEKIKEEKKKQFIANKIAAISAAAINTAIAVTNAFAFVPPPANVIAAALIGGLGAAQIAVIASQPVPEFKIGGFTEKANDNNKPVGIVHANEYVIPAWQVQSPKFKHTIQDLESSRQKGFASGGFVTPTDTSSEINAILTQQNNLIAKIVERPSIVSVQEIQTASSNVNKVKVKATL